MIYQHETIKLLRGFDLIRDVFEGDDTMIVMMYLKARWTTKIVDNCIFIFYANWLPAFFLLLSKIFLVIVIRIGFHSKRIHTAERISEQPIALRDTVQGTIRKNQIAVSLDNEIFRFLIEPILFQVTRPAFTVTLFATGINFVNRN